MKRLRTKRNVFVGGNEGVCVLKNEIGRKWMSEERMPNTDCQNDLSKDFCCLVCTTTLTNRNRTQHMWRLCTCVCNTPASTTWTEAKDWTPSIELGLAHTQTSGMRSRSLVRMCVGAIEYWIVRTVTTYTRPAYVLSPIQSAAVCFVGTHFEYVWCTHNER